MKISRCSSENIKKYKNVLYILYIKIIKAKKCLKHFFVERGPKYKIETCIVLGIVFCSVLIFLFSAILVCYIYFQLYLC